MTQHFLIPAARVRFTAGVDGFVFCVEGRVKPVFLRFQRPRAQGSDLRRAELKEVGLILVFVRCPGWNNKPVHPAAAVRLLPAAPEQASPVDPRFQETSV